MENGTYHFWLRLSVGEEGYFSISSADDARGEIGSAHYFHCKRVDSLMLDDCLSVETIFFKFNTAESLVLVRRSAFGTE